MSTVDLLEEEFANEVAAGPRTLIIDSASI
jgi:hypothetical protein